MIRIATPVSTLFEDPAAAAEIIAASDCLECRDHTAGKMYPHEELFHCEAQLVHAWSAHEKDAIARAVATRPGLRLATFHCASCCTKPVVEGRMYAVGGSVLTKDALLANARKNVTWLREALPQTVEIGVENNNYYPMPAYDHVTDGDFLTELVKGNNIRFLFDLAHARISAHNKKMPHAEYVRSLPMDAVMQLHICKSGIDDAGMAIDTHHAPDAEVFAEVRNVIVHHPTVQYLTVEYYRDAKGLLQALQECRALAADR